MTIQNIEDVMDRIMNLNKNLNEESLTTLLSASGWDKEDIMEGLHIFKSTKGNVAPAVPNFYQPAQASSSAPIPPIPQAPTPSPAPAPDYATQNVENNYTFSIKPKADLETKSTFVKDTEILPTKEINHSIENTEIKAPTPGIISSIDNAPIPSLSSSMTPPEAPKRNSGNLGKIIYFIILALVLTGIIFYLYNSGLLNNKANTQVENPATNNTVNIVDNVSPVNVDQNVPTTTETVSNDLTQTQINDLIKEVNTLKTQLANYKKSGQTIVKYISQRGASGRGVSSIDATSTGFVINYTDKTSTIVPYSPTTILNILNSNSVCFIDQNATSTNSTSTDVCLERNSVLKLLNK